ncbi:ABC transporter permease [Azoarcus taiwanensis]|uniref:FtsX-like permease family protein n=1 Tax=Azoarcus taiwanensis TaxID=666964 RepID=A0A972J7H1_9RHOO|nr:FtsX-like permease family protein [Azoarcus taiwanensis]NMG01869.1 FtsX-like permease family protein [Azoarcus taiwanensis]
MATHPALDSAWRNVIRQVGRSRAALVAIVFGMVAMILASGFIAWNLEFGRENTIRSQLGHIQVVKPGFLEGGRADPHAYLLGSPSPAELSTLASLPGFTASAPRMLISGLASSGEQTLSFIGEGVDPAAEALLSAALRFPDGRNLMAGETDTVIVGRGLADNLQIAVGERLVLISNTPDGGISAVEATLVGVFESITKAYDDVALRVPIALARALTRAEGEHLRLILLDRTEDTDGAVTLLRERLAAERLEFVPWHDLADFYKKSAELLSKQVGVIYVIIAVIIVLSISNTMMMVVMERTGEIGTIMALGARRHAVLTMFMLEGCILGAVGVVAGLALAVVCALVLSAIGIPMPPGPGMAWGFDAGIRLSAQNLTTASVVAFSTTVLASIYPAWRASRLQIVDALRARQ